MKQRILALCAALSLVSVFIACQAGGTNREASATGSSSSSAANSSTNPASKPTIEEIRAVLTAHDKALNDKNIDAVMATFSNDPTTVVMGTGAEERWMGPPEIRAAYTEMFKDYDPGTMHCDCSQFKTGGSDEAGTMAWLAASCACEDSLQNKKREYKLNVSATVTKQPEGWRFISLHMSNAFEPPVTK